ncbi:MAG TPA: hypothetical protein DHV62_00560, partial [Elusimicrobia bacterium]|nr:hypothetical protein [Elusimicrobiota bacterium]
ALADDSFGFHYNPAGLAQTKNSEIGTMYLTGLTDEYYAFLSGITKIGKKDTLGVSIFYLDGGKFEWNKTDGTVETLKAIEDIVFTLAYAYQENKYLSLGVNLKTYSSKLLEQYKANAYAIDFGILLKIIDGLKTGFSVQNIGTKIKCDPLPLTGRIGLSYQKIFLDNYFSVVTDYIYRYQENTFQNFGLEYGWGGLFIFRTGYSSGYESNRLSLGIGLRRNLFQFDYAYTFTGNFQPVHSISLIYRMP